jgi:hypothetical protein
MKEIPKPADPGIPYGEPYPAPVRTNEADKAKAAYESLKANPHDELTIRRLTGRLYLWPTEPQPDFTVSHS